MPDAVPPIIHIVDVEPAIVTPGETIYVMVYATDDTGVVMVNADGSLLANAGGGMWMGTITAKNELGLHNVTIHAVDDAGNASSDSSGSYTVKRVFALNNKAAKDPIIGSVAEKYLFVVYGKVNVVDSGQFTVDDGAGAPINVHIINHNLSGGEYVRVRGSLVREGSQTYLQSSGEYLTYLAEPSMP